MARISEIIFPRVTGLVITCDSQGKPNIATFSFLMPISFEPKYVAFSVSPKRKTFENLREVGEFVLAIPSREMLDKVWGCGTQSGRDVDKFSLLGLERERAKTVKPPLVKSFPVQLECKVEFMKEFGDHYLVVGRVLEEHITKLDFEPVLHYSKNIFFVPSEKITV
ncbi:MAG: flavin reductase family protein [Candidatus Brockarchaeota archaeon]|nr:flavin reductase family protein [Candidatus Brockarchaeota archaeon]MBO3840506.1 flavin reductase family protein [Candidatus Brockarchaeota archaeon]